MDSAYLGAIVGAILTAAAIIAYQSTTDGAKAKLHRWLQSWAIRIIQLWLFLQGGFVIVKFFGTDAPPTRGEIGYLLLAVFNCLAWGYFITRDFIDYLKRRNQRGNQGFED